MGDNSTDVCVVCQDPFDDETPTATTPCNHTLHSTCFLSAALASDRCPVCRANLYPQEDNNHHNNSNTLNDSHSIEIDITSTIGEDTFRSIQEQVSRLRNSRLGAENDEEREEGEISIIEINEPPSLRRSRLTLSAFNACRDGNLEEVRRLVNTNDFISTVEDDSFDTLLHRAIFSEHEALIRFLIHEAAIPVNSINNFRMTPLHYAVSSGVSIPTLLLNCGAFVDAQDSAGKTPLMSACGYNNTEVAKLLHDRGASTRTFDGSGETCMHYAARGKCLTVLRFLLRQTRADANAPNFLDETPLHLACASGSHTAVRFLLEAGADPTTKTKSGKTAL
ncbi:unnamed protein product, partial [Sphacelaria rigidula]